MYSENHEIYAYFVILAVKINELLTYCVETKNETLRGTFLGMLSYFHSSVPMHILCNHYPLCLIFLHWCFFPSSESLCLMIGLKRFCNFERPLSKSILRMGNCMEVKGIGEGSSVDEEAVVNKNQNNAGKIQKIEVKQKARILCLHGWRTNGDILSMQMAALQANTDMDCFFIDAPFPGRGEPDKGIAFFYPDRQYYEWFYRTKVDKSAVPDMSIPSGKSGPFAGYDNLDESMEYLSRHIDITGPYDGLLGFSQGASMVTRLVQLQKEEMKNNPLKKKNFNFVILVGGVPPQELVDKNPLFTTPSLHIMGSIDPLLPDSQLLHSLYSDTPKRETMVHEEGHNIPSMRTELYPKIQAFLTAQMIGII